MPENIFTPYFAWENVDTFSFSALLGGAGRTMGSHEAWTQAHLPHVGSWDES